MTKTWMLPLLLLAILAHFHQSSSAPSCGEMLEFADYVNNSWNGVKNCSEDCNSVDDTDITCKCLNISVSNTGCAFPDYFINGLELLKNRPSSSPNAIKHLHKALHKIKRECGGIIFCSLALRYEPFISPNTFHKKLELFHQLISDQTA